MDFAWKSRKGKGKLPETLPGMIPARTKGRGARGVAAAPLGEEKMWDWLELKAQGASGVLEILREIPNPAFWRETIIFGITGSYLTTAHLLGYSWKDFLASLEFQPAGGGSGRTGAVFL